MRTEKWGMYYRLVIELQDIPHNPYDEDGYCYYCGNGSWKHHMPHCLWADLLEGLVMYMSGQGWFVCERGGNP